MPSRAAGGLRHVRHRDPPGHGPAARARSRLAPARPLAHAARADRARARRGRRRLRAHEERFLPFLGRQRRWGRRRAVAVTAISAYDPFGDHVENSGAVGNATDGSLATYWETEHYATPSFGNLKPGVGLVLDAGSTRKLGSLTVKSTTPGYRAVIRSGDSATGPFTADSSVQSGSASTVFELNGNDARYYVIWLTDLGPVRPGPHQRRSLPPSRDAATRRQRRRRRRLSRPPARRCSRPDRSASAAPGRCRRTA